jgi:hypothetical protein
MLWLVIIILFLFLMGWMIPALWVVLLVLILIAVFGRLFR